MFWSKLWLALITLACGLGVAVALLAPRPLGEDLSREASARLERAQHAASLLLKVNARKWMDTAAQVATDAVLVESLEQATRGPADLGLVHKTVQERLRYFNDKMKVDLVIATDAKGRVIARAGLDESIYKDGVEGFPLVADALRGLRGDDTWSLDGKLYRVAASPVIARDRYAGSLVVGQEVGGELAQSMKQVLEVDVAFLLRGRVLASSSQLPVLTRLPLEVDRQAAELAHSGHTGAITVETGEAPYLVVLAPFVGEAAGHKAIYALLLPRPGTAAIGPLVQKLLQSDLKTLPWTALAPVGGAVLLALILGMLLMRLEADRPLKRMSRDAQALARGEVQRLDDDRHPGKLGTIARAVNTTLDRLGSSTGRSGPVAIRPVELPARQPAPPPAPSLFGDLSDPGPLTERAAPRPPRPADATPIYDADAVAEMAAQSRAADPDLTPPPIAPEITGVTRPKLQLPSLDQDHSEQLTNPSDGPDGVDAGPGFKMPPLKPSTPAQPRRIPTPRPAPVPSFGDDDPTQASGNAQKMRELIASTRHPIVEAPPPPPPPGLSPDEEALETELQQVFHDFLETKQRLGEPTEGVTYDKFSVKLKANRAQLITRYACKTVKFQVYVKDGKAALKATPVQA